MRYKGSSLSYAHVVLGLQTIFKASSSDLQSLQSSFYFFMNLELIKSSGDRLCRPQLTCTGLALDLLLQRLWSISRLLLGNCSKIYISLSASDCLLVIKFMTYLSLLKNWSCLFVCVITLTLNCLVFLKRILNLQFGLHLLFNRSSAWRLTSYGIYPPASLQLIFSWSTHFLDNLHSTKPTDVRSRRDHLTWVLFVLIAAYELYSKAMYIAAYLITLDLQINVQNRVDWVHWWPYICRLCGDCSMCFITTQMQRFICESAHQNITLYHADWRTVMLAKSNWYLGMLCIGIYEIDFSSHEMVKWCFFYLKCSLPCFVNCHRALINHRYTYHCSKPYIFLTSLEMSAD